jgi:hypothetical protein
MPNDTDPHSHDAPNDRAAGPVARALVPLPELGVIAVSGADAISFLQAQLTNDVAHLSAADMQLNGYCTAKGRLLATFHQWRHGDDVMLRLPRETLPAVMKRLSMFVLRAKVRLADVSDAWTTTGLLGAADLPGPASSSGMRASIACRTPEARTGSCSPRRRSRPCRPGAGSFPACRRARGGAARSKRPSRPCSPPLRRSSFRR